jgi:hypothetical protein
MPHIIDITTPLDTRDAAAMLNSGCLVSTGPLSLKFTRYRNAVNSLLSAIADNDSGRIEFWSRVVVANNKALNA